MITPDDGHSRCPKHAEFRDKIKQIGHLMHLVGYLYEDYHDARSLEHKVEISFECNFNTAGKDQGSLSDVSLD
jgi:hypothetical protein